MSSLTVAIQDFPSIAQKIHNRAYSMILKIKTQQPSHLSQITAKKI